METEEIWKPIKGYESLYEVSNLGRVKRLPRSVNSCHGAKTTLKEKILLGTIRNSTIIPIYYLQLKKSNGKFSYISLPKVVLSSFYENSITGFKFKDGNSLNSRLDNLELINFDTHTYNTVYYINNRNKIKEKAKQWVVDNPEAHKIKMKKFQQKQRDNLTDVYIKQRLTIEGASKEERENSQLIEAKRQIIKIKRLCKQLKN
jgi:hypothetical protein